MRFIAYLPQTLFHGVLQIIKEDILPKKLCQQCFSDLTFVYGFINKCHKSEEILQSYIKSDDNPTEYTEIDEIKIKVEEHDLPIEFQYETETTIVKEEFNVGSDNIEVKYYICNICSKCKYVIFKLLCEILKSFILL